MANSSAHAVGTSAHAVGTSGRSGGRSVAAAGTGTNGAAWSVRNKNLPQAPALTVKKLSFSVVLGLFLVFSFVIPPHAEASDKQVHVFKFYLDSAFLENKQKAQQYLPKYIADINYILAKNTNVYLEFDPETDIIFVDDEPFSGNYIGILPTDDFEIWAYVIKTQESISYGGYNSLDVSGAGVLAGLYWTKIYNPSKLNEDQLQDYWTQINNMLHEMAHVFGAGIGEYYNLQEIEDSTGTTPILNIDISDSTDSFWKNKKDFFNDPLLQNAVYARSFTKRAKLLKYTAYSKLTAAIINGSYRNSLPSIDLQNIVIRVTDENGMGIPDANIKIWSIPGMGVSYEAMQLVDAFTDNDGRFSFSWGVEDPHNNYDFLRLIKVYKDTYIPTAKYVSVFDADIQKIVKDHDTWEIVIKLSLGRRDQRSADQGYGY